ncbi:hypothetical protein EV401DRAFT_2072777 [Pisolithus croceorrhizus]|nr:hypothetical protein EV401DRAFT_2072777 [Pisolithus croceorrhizus]
MERPVRPGSKASQFSSSTSLEVWQLTHSLQDYSKLLKVPEDGLRGQALKVDGIKDPLNEPQDAQDEPRTDKQPVEAAACALEVLKPPLEPKDDLCEVL